MREVVFDTETTGFDPEKGDRLIEIGCVELFDRLPTGRTLHLLINPQRDVPAAAVEVHGITTEMLKDKPIFGAIADEFLEFIGDAPLVAHNAEFDFRFINWELRNIGRDILPARRMVDTLEIAKRKFPGAKATLDMLCTRFGIDRSARVKHGALLDAQLLAEVYLELMGGRQNRLELVADVASATEEIKVVRTWRAPRPHEPTEEELAAHAAFLDKMKKPPIWRQA
ncbi:DNA polymerase III subunit epsilon [Pedomonas mirosovicensis]|uniref:DNA polymerase III subunit epsilon n=1 Tax=Pedomonas mirosovicensis TaxID=2908641 RepID=UPI002169B33A|nr:DNA polymerase III subunit epsilon [Pedomonas mirosovicensis]MCH8684100.1 DNA polymerase III subunit epsilon [Pedomonas mirosovicensis]